MSRNWSGSVIQYLHLSTITLPLTSLEPSISLSHSNVEVQYMSAGGESSTGQVGPTPRPLLQFIKNEEGKREKRDDKEENKGNEEEYG